MTSVLVVHSSDELYGADRVLLTLARHLDPSYRLTVVVPDDLPYGGELSAALAAAGVPVRTMALAVLRRRYLTPLGLLRYLGRLAASTWALRRLIRAEGFDVVHSFTTAVVPGALAARLARVPHVWSAHELVLRPRAVARVIAWLLPRLSARVVAVSAAMRDHLAAGDARNADAAVIPNAVDADRFAAPPEAVAAVRRELGGEGALLVGTAGRLRPSKGQQVLVEAAALVADRRARFVIAGTALPGEEAHHEALRDRVGALGLEDRFVFTGFRDDLPALLAALDVFVAPSIHPESFGLGTLEAMAAGTAVVATRLGATPELVEDGTTGRLVPPDDPAALAAALDDLLADPRRRDELAAAGRRRVGDEYGVARFTARWAEVYDAARQGRGHG